MKLVNSDLGPCNPGGMFDFVAFLSIFQLQGNADWYSMLQSHWASPDDFIAQQCNKFGMCINQYRKYSQGQDHAQIFTNIFPGTGRWLVC